MKPKTNEKKSLKELSKIPEFMVIAALSMILVIGFIGYTLLYFSPEEIIPYSGYAISGKDITENLLDENYEEIEKPKTVRVDEQEMVFKKLNRYYIGQKEKQEINLDYPIYINEKIALYNLSNRNTLLTEDFKEVDSYPRYILSDGVLYNEGELERADKNTYLFIKNEDNIVMNQFPIEIKTQYHKYEMGTNSIICFQEKMITYYTIDNDKLIYHKIEDIDFASNVTMKEKEYSYEELLIRLKLKEETVKTEKAEEEIIKEENIQESKTETKQETKPEESKPEESQTNQEENEVSGEHVYIKPEVTATDFEANVYSSNATIGIKDPNGEITSPVTFEFRKKGKIYLRKAVLSSGRLEILGLEPNETYTILGSYIYKNEEGKKIQKEFFSQEIHTKGVETLEPIHLRYENGEIFSNKIQIKNLKISSDLTAEALKGVKSVTLEANGISYKIPNSRINEMLKGQEVIQETQDNLSSNDKIQYEFKFYDIQGHELRVENSVGETRTAKAKPTVTVKVQKQEISQVDIALTLKNKDDAKLENYRYVVQNSKGDTIQEATIDSKQQVLELRNLDPNQYYKVSIFANYDIEDGKGMQENQVLGSCNFTSVPLSILGYLNLDTKIKELTKGSAKIEASINQDRTDERLTYILHQISVSIYEQTKEDKKLIVMKTLEGEPIEKLKLAEKIEIELEGFNSNTTYYVEMNAVLKQGSTEEKINIMQPLEKFITKKEPAEILIRNQFVTGSMIDFDVKVKDMDEAILTGKVRMELRDERNKLVKMENIPVNEDYLRLTYEKLEERANYTICFYADEYNEGSDDSTYENNYLLKKLEIYTQPGISGDIGLTNLERKTTGKNLIDVRSDIKWHSTFYQSSAYYEKTYHQKTKELKLGVIGTQGQIYFYNLQEYVGQTVTVSFLAKRDKNSENTLIYLQNSKNGTNRSLVEGITQEEWKRYTYTITVNKTGYVGFYLVGKDTMNRNQAFLLKELQVEVGTKRTTYEEYQYNVEGKLRVDLTDQRNEIVGKDYYIQILEDGITKGTNQFIEIDENGKVEGAIKQYPFEENKSYDINLLVKVRDRFYVIATTNFSTEGEIRGISTIEEFKTIQPSGNYIILKDIDVRGKNIWFGSEPGGFEGKIDFQGHKLIKDAAYQNTTFYNIKKEGVIENLVLDFYLNNASEGSYGGLFHTNRGTIRNIMVNLKQCTEVPNKYTRLLGDTNHSTGIIENFVIHLEVPLYGANYLTGGVHNNYGIIRNGYLYGENIKATFPIIKTDWRSSAGLVIENISGGMVENVYSLINIETTKIAGGTRNNTGNLIVNNNAGAIARNMYSVGIASVYEDLNYGPTINASGGRANQVYYFSDETFTNTTNIKTSKLALYDTKFQNLRLNSQGQFFVDDLVTQNYYPQVKMSSKMPNQEYLSLLEVEEKDLADILSYEVIEEKEDAIRMEFSVNNPSAEQIRSIQIKDVSTAILSQKYADGKSTVIVELKNPVRYISKYSVMSITSQGVANLPYTRNFKENERIVFVDFYRKVSSIEDWKQINKLSTENYRLMEDLDFINCGNEICISSAYSGKLDGNGKTIKNIKLSNNIYSLIYQLSGGEVRNLTIENYTHDRDNMYQSYLGVFGFVKARSIIDNVHIKNEKLSSTNKQAQTNIGGLVGCLENSEIKNSSITGLSIKVQGGTMIRVGGMVGLITNSNIENCYIQDLELNVKKALIYDGIGGFIGQGTTGGSNIKKCYAIGNMITDAENTGGMVGITNGVVRNCYAMVHMNSQTDYVGGIVGFDKSTSTQNITENLSLGNIYSRKTSEFVNRVIGSNTTERGNYGYTEQKINGFKSTQDLGAEQLLTNQEVLEKETYLEKLDFGEAFHYDQLEEGILPKLYNTDGTHLLPNQRDHKLEEKEIFIEEVEAEKADVNTAMVRIIVQNPSQVKITGVEIEDTKVKLTGSVNQGTKTYIDLMATPEKAYDSYEITKLFSEEGEIQTQGKLDLQFYREINSFEDWQKIDEESAQNYRLNADIDFAGKFNPNLNVSIGRLEAEGEGHTLKNLEINLEGTGGLIRELKNSMKNINFENITIHSTSGGFYTGLIVRNIADIEKINFKDITIQAEKISRVGMIALSSGWNFRNITLENITVEGKEYVGGLIGEYDSGTFEYIDIETANIRAEGAGVGSIFGKVRTARPQNDLNYMTANQVNVKGGDYTGGIIGFGVMGRSVVTNSHIEGNNHVGGIGGELNNQSSGTVDLLVQDCTIVGNGNVGGVAGIHTSMNRSFSIRNTILAKGNNVGGIGGNHTSGIVNSCAVIDTNISTSGMNAGGIDGKLESGLIDLCYAYHSSVEANQYAGGLVGVMRQGYLRYCYTNNTITAYSDSAGGMVGYLNNEGMTGAAYISYIVSNYVADAHITSVTQVGGMIGKIFENLYDTKFLSKNYIEAYLNSNTTAVSLGVGSKKSQNDRLEDFYVYEKSTINHQMVTPEIDHITEKNRITQEELRQQATYQKIGLNGTYFDYNTITQEKYPMLNVNFGEKAPVQEGIALPNDQNRGDLLDTMLSNTSFEKTEELPEVQIYPVEVNKINLELEDMAENLILNYTVEGEETKSVPIDKKVYTFAYDYQTEVELELTNGKITKRITIHPEEVANTISLIEGDTYTLKEGRILKETEELEGEYVNLYLEKALSTEGKIYHITEQTWEEEITKGFVLLKETYALETQEYNGMEIATFATFTTLTKEDKTTQKQGRILVRSGQLAFLDGNTKIPLTGEVVNQYNGKEYQTILGEDKKIYDLKTPLNYPENFVNKNIISLTAQDDVNQPFVTIAYESGKVLTFNYVTGETIFDNQVKQDISLMDYIKQAFSKEGIQENVTENAQKEYKASEALKEKLEQNPIEKVMEKLQKTENNTNVIHTQDEESTNSLDSGNTSNLNTMQTDTKYVTAYDSKTKEYVVYKESELLDLDKEEYQSENTKISQNAGLTEFYATNQEEVKQTNGLVWIVPTMIGILSSLAILLKRNRNKAKRK